MPLRRGQDPVGIYWQWGNTGHKYYFVDGDELSEHYAKHAAIMQYVAAKYHGYSGKL